MSGKTPTGCGFTLKAPISEPGESYVHYRSACHLAGIILTALWTGGKHDVIRFQKYKFGQKV